MRTVSRRHIGWIVCTLLIVLVGSLAWRTFRTVQQERLNYSLIVAIKSRDREVLALLQQGADPNARDNKGTPGSPQPYVTDLFSQVRGRRSTIRETGEPALLLAASRFSRQPWDRFGKADPVIIEALLKAGASPNARNESGWTAMTWAVGSGDDACVRLLLDRGADVNASGTFGLTTLMMAVSHENAPCVRLLLAKGADVNAKTDDGVTALMMAARYGNVALVKLILDSGADMNARDKHGWTALDIASSDPPTPDIIKILKQAGAKK